MNRNESVDAFRLIASFAVILLHVRYGDLPAEAVNNIRLLGRFGVPFFFLISGYFFFQNYAKNGDSAFNKTLQRLVGIFITASLIYGLLKFNRIRLDYLLLFDGTNLHLWFISSMISGIIFCWYYCSCLKSKTAMYVISGLIIILSLVSDAYSYLLPFKIDASFTRYLLSVPFLFAGMLIAEKQLKISNNYSIALIVTGILLQVAESRYLFSAHGYNPYDLQFMAGTIPFSFGVFFISFNGYSNPVLGKLGRKYALAIYIWHPVGNYFIFTVISKLLADTGIIFIFSPVISFGFIFIALYTIGHYFPALFAVLNGELNKLPRIKRKKQLTIT